MRKTSARGYGRKHQLERAKWRSVIHAGNGYCTEPICLMPSRWIQPGTQWDLAHGDTRDTYRGPAHARCNRSEGARRGITQRNQRPVDQPTKRAWLL